MSSSISSPVELPPDLQAVLNDLDKSDEEARRIIGGLSDTQVNWQPSPSAWSIAQCLDHLARASNVYAVALNHAVKDPRSRTKPRRGPIQPRGWFSRLFIRSLEPPPKPKMRAPRKIIPASRIDGQEALEAFLRAHDAIRAVIRDAAALDLNRIRFHNPFIGLLRFTVGTGLLIIASHDRRHLWQAEQVRQSNGFPAK